jgi:hypothetical protein
MPPGGAKLLYSQAGGWACVCEAGYAGASCTTATSSARVAHVSSPSCAAPPACGPPGGTDTYTFDNNGTAACICASGYAGAPCALAV